MKLRKLISTVAAASVATTALATAAGATLIAVPQDGYVRSSSASFLVMLYSDGTFDASEKAVTNYGLDLTQIGTIDFTVKAADPDWFSGDFGGGLVLSSKSAANQAHNWNSKEYWGVTDEEAEIDTLADKPVQFKKVGDYTYAATLVIDDSNCVYDDTQFVQLAIQDWGVDEIEVVSIVVKDKSGAEMISFDSQGKASLPLITDDAAAPAEEAEEEDAAPAEEAEEEEDAAPAEEAEEDTAADEDDADADVDEDDAEEEEVAAPAEEAEEEEAPVVVAPAAPAAGDVAASTDSSKGSPDTGIADVAAIAGLAVVAAGAIVVAKKSK